MKSIKLVFQGGLGNQLFQLAYGLHLQNKYNCKVFYDVSKYKTEKIEYRDFELDAFGLPEDWVREPIKNGRIRRFGLRYCFYLPLTYIFAKLKGAFPRKKFFIDHLYLTLTNFIGVHRIHYYYKYQDPGFSILSQILIYGNWFWRDMVFPQEQTLKDMIVSRRTMSSENLDMLNRIKSSNSVGVHIRRGDYVALGKIACTIKYYEHSINEIADRVKDAVFFVFSDDINWVKQNLHTDKQVVFVDNNNDTVDDFTLFSSCCHFIMSNSTFSWWSAFLGKCPSKLVFVPQYWDLEDLSTECPFLMNTWQKVDNRKFL